jgi:hypothetical protein
MDDRRVVQCNYAVATRVAARGARAYVGLHTGGSVFDTGDIRDGRIMVLVRSRGGRWVHKWERIAHLRDFRIKNLPPRHPLYNDDRIYDAHIVDRSFLAHVEAIIA